MTIPNQTYPHCSRSVESLALDVALYGICPNCQTRHNVRAGDKESAEAIGCDHYFHVALHHLREHMNSVAETADNEV